MLFVVNEVAHYGEFKKILTSAKIRSSIDHVILFDRDGYDPYLLFSREIKDCQANGFNFTTLYRSTPQNKVGHSRIVRQVIAYKNKIQDLKIFFKNHQITSIVLGEENILMDTFLYKKSLGSGKCFVYPYTIPNPKEMAGGAAFFTSKYTFLGFLLFVFGGRFTKTFRQNIFLLISPYKIFAMFLVGYFPRRPWILNADTADLVCIESQKMADLYKKIGVQKSRLSVIGTINDDILAEIMTEKLIRKTAFQKKYGLPEKPMILVGFPPNQYPIKSAEKANYAELMTSWAESLRPFLGQYNIVVTKHPRTTQNFDSMLQMGFVVAAESTVELIPLASLYIASVSATIRWALAAGVPVINYDTYQYKYGDYENAIGVSNLYSEIEFKKELLHILNDSSYYSDWVERLAQEATLWGVLDGKAADRFLGLFNLANSKGDSSASS